ncbi:MAG: hypothetical protein C7B44_12865 [Sulfobacillus thermosulfidooxidans]|uniref:Uncharacterized protein n=1 Tax=Sulfobacillus thermotolerans TaxID=338644 RepID=A0ABM6RPW0_9FIRM|nr:hypothetical protein [Sulfobacillus sp. hq2]AUW93339.1 hypothetical protein BXT84_04695 [Sulfobacillus thermotolerans]MCY0909116.1 hypothetical protein [Sulfobacillus thermotolerans]POB10572.1 hypothetical protein CO251_06940 [Sulfobacillus sp. hq2]PSR35701.1 MAG: hypothetical protein C7B44_12865 [Sulfobacillus thermosulfidooxidans]
MDSNRKGLLWLAWPVVSTALFVLMFRSESGLPMHTSWRITIALAAIFFIGQSALGFWLFWMRAHQIAPPRTRRPGRVIDLTAYRNKESHMTDSSRR